MAVFMVVVSACGDALETERWSGYYSFTADADKHPIYMEMTIDGSVVKGSVWQDGMVTASVAGTIQGSDYVLRLHPLGEPAEGSEDVHYRATRVLDRLYGEFGDAIGGGGFLYLRLTDLPAGEVPDPSGENTVIGNGRR